MRNKFYQYLYGNLSTSYFKATSDCLSIYLKGSTGLFRVDLPCKADTDEIKYFSVDRESDTVASFELNKSV